MTDEDLRARTMARVEERRKAKAAQAVAQAGAQPAIAGRDTAAAPAAPSAEPPAARAPKFYSVDTVTGRSKAVAPMAAPASDKDVVLRWEESGQHVVVSSGAKVARAGQARIERGDWQLPEAESAPARATSAPDGPAQTRVLSASDQESVNELRRLSRERDDPKIDEDETLGRLKDLIERGGATDRTVFDAFTQGLSTEILERDLDMLEDRRAAFDALALGDSTTELRGQKDEHGDLFASREAVRLRDRLQAVITKRRGEQGTFEGVERGGSPVEEERLPFTAENLSEVFGISYEEARAAETIAEEMGLDTDTIKLTVGGTPGAGALTQGVGSSAFKRWFGDSKVVDERGAPLVVYHGTPARFQKFHAPAYFAASQEEAREFGDEKFDGTARVMPVYLKIENPKIVKLFEDFVEWTDWDIDRLKSQGHDGAIFRPGDGRPDLYVAFEPTQIKSADKNRGTFDPKNPNILYQAAENAPALRRWYYSNIDQALQTWQNKGTADQLLAHLKKFKGAMDEATEIAMDAWLKVRESVTRDEAREFLNRNRIDVQEVTRGDGQTLKRRYADTIAFLERKGYQVEEPDDDNQFLGLIRIAQNEAEVDHVLAAWEIDELPEDILSAWQVLEDADTERATDPKYAQYQVPGGTNYREVLLTLPSSTEVGPKVPDGAGGLVAPTLAAGWQRIEGRQPGSRDFQSGHWDEPNVLAHIRMNDRVIPEDPDAEIDATNRRRRILFIEEIQSDWLQSHRRMTKALDEKWAEVVLKMKLDNRLRVVCP